MKQEKDKRKQHHASESNPQQSVEAGKKGGTQASQVTNRATNYTPQNRTDNEQKEQKKKGSL